MAQVRTAQTIVDQALRSINAIGTGETPTSDERSEGLEALQDLIGSLSAELIIPYIDERESFSLVADQSAYTMGSGGDFNTVRPIQIIGAAGDGGSGLEIDYDIIDAAKYRRIGLKSSAGPPAWLWYNPVYPLGEIKLYPTPGGVYTIYIDSLKPITEPSALATNVSVPEGYNRMLRFNLAVDLSSEYEVPDRIFDRLVRQAQQTKDALIALQAAARVEEAVVDVPGAAGTVYDIESG